MASFPLTKYSGLAILNLTIVAIIGVLMRYKIGFEFPWFDQKNLQHAHSHFAFAGWITHTLFFLIVRFGLPQIAANFQRKFNFLITINLICSYGMLVSFSMQGYGVVSIAFSTLSMVSGWLFTFLFFRHTTSLPGTRWIKAGLLFNLLSSAGTLVLAVMMATKNYNEDLYLGSVYFYLHFQYNGWFFFSCIGIFLNYLNERHGVSPLKRVFNMLAFSCIPAFLLSVLWLHLPLWLLIICAIAAIVQLIGWAKLLIAFRPAVLQEQSMNRTLLLLVAIAGSVKFLLQAGSTIPDVSQLAFGFRTIVIAYLHLVLLAFISLFLITFLHMNQFILLRRNGRTGLVVFTFGIAFNEFILLIQGIASFSYLPVKSAPLLLLLAGLMMLTGIVWMVSDHFQLSRKHPKNEL